MHIPSQLKKWVPLPMNIHFVKLWFYAHLVIAIGPKMCVYIYVCVCVLGTLNLDQTIQNRFPINWCYGVSEMSFIL